jgi:hypothetical protein
LTSAKNNGAVLAKPDEPTPADETSVTGYDQYAVDVPGLVTVGVPLICQT